MDYIAKHYVRFSKTTYTPGEFIDEPMTEEQKNRLLKLGAIAPCEQTVFLCRLSRKTLTRRITLTMARPRKPSRRRMTRKKRP